MEYAYIYLTYKNDGCLIPFTYWINYVNYILPINRTPQGSGFLYDSLTVVSFDAGASNSVVSIPIWPSLNLSALLVTLTSSSTQS